MKYNFYIDTKFTVWERSHRVIEANSEEEAKEIAKNIFSEDWGQNEVESETIQETMESMSIEDNGGQATCELVWDNSILMDNRPLDIVRDEKIDEILNEK